MRAPASGAEVAPRPTAAARGSSPLRRGALLGLIVAAHLGGLAMLARLAGERPVPAELMPIQVALIAAPAVAEPLPAPPEPVVEPPRPPEPRPVARPPEPTPPTPPMVKKPTPKPVVKKPAPVTESPTAL
ncbi:TonB family protein, partial [Thauera aminoaromatica S2]